VERGVVGALLTSPPLLVYLSGMAMSFDEFTRKFGLRLNAQQEAAVRSTRGPVLLLAVPGSGKTTVVVARIAYMIYCLGAAPGSILTMTYTVAATEEMRARFADRFGGEYADKLEFCTINALCARVIRHYGSARGRSVFELESSESGAGAAGRVTGIYRQLYGRAPSEGDVREIMTQIAYCKNMQLRGDAIREIKLENGAFSDIYELYCASLVRDRLMDYDDQLRYALAILRKHPDILGAIRGRYRYINVDEAQDTSKIQHSLIALLASGHRNLFMVGDEDQSIYGFRAAYPRALLDFDRQYAPAVTLLMERNYRSTGEIVRRALSIIRQNTDRRDKRMFTTNELGAPVRCTVVSDFELQYHYLSEAAASAVAESRELAVLYRNNESAIPIIDVLDRTGVPYSGGPPDDSFFTHYIARDIAGIVRFALRPEDFSLFVSIYRTLDLRLRADDIDRLRARHGASREKDVVKALLADNRLGGEASSRVALLRDALGDIRGARGSDIVTAVVDMTGYGRYLKARRADSARVSTMKALAALCRNADAFLRRIDELRRMLSQGREAGEHGADKSRSGVTLSTIHSSKGLEFDHVIIVDAALGVLPGGKPHAIGGPGGERARSVMEEERRMFYVAVTRARKQLEFVTYDREFGEQTNRGFPFVDALLADSPPIID
jgi:DNA helicase-2/ATP-dependent DNA helicase PcrA